MLGVGYFLHPVSVPMFRMNRHKQHNERDMTIGYSLVFVTYIMIGTFGYIGFIGSGFANFLKNADPDNFPIAQNCIVMFSEGNGLVFVVRILIFCLVGSSFPLLSYFVRATGYKLIRELRGQKLNSD
jgi:amino acid permease